VVVATANCGIVEAIFMEADANAGYVVCCWRAQDGEDSGLEAVMESICGRFEEHVRMYGEAATVYVPWAYQLASAVCNCDAVTEARRMVP
jgi:hypothetical protein